jgi:hypothetical protein
VSKLIVNDHLHPLFKRILEPLMSKPRTQEELDAQAKLDERLIHTPILSAPWGRNIRLSGDKGVGRTYERRCIGATRDGNVPVYEQVEKGIL